MLYDKNQKRAERISELKVDKNQISNKLTMIEQMILSNTNRMETNSNLDKDPIKKILHIEKIQKIKLTQLKHLRKSIGYITITLISALS